MACRTHDCTVYCTVCFANAKLFLPDLFRCLIVVYKIVVRLNKLKKTTVRNRCCGASYPTFPSGGGVCAQAGVRITPRNHFALSLITTFKWLASIISPSEPTNSHWFAETQRPTIPRNTHANQSTSITPIWAADTSIPPFSPSDENGI